MVTFSRGFNTENFFKFPRHNNAGFQDFFKHNIWLKVGGSLLEFPDLFGYGHPAYWTPPSWQGHRHANFQLFVPGRIDVRPKLAIRGEDITNKRGKMELLKCHVGNGTNVFLYYYIS